MNSLTSEKMNANSKRILFHCGQELLQVYFDGDQNLYSALLYNIDKCGVPGGAPVGKFYIIFQPRGGGIGGADVIDVGVPVGDGVVEGTRPGIRVIYLKGIENKTIG